MSALARIGLVLALAGCTTIDMHKDPPADWPKLEVFEHHVSFGEMYEACRKYTAWYMVPLACARVRPHLGRCDIWVVKGGDVEDLLAHEREHCAGRDHPGSDQLARLWAWHKARRAQHQVSAAP